MVLDRRGIPSGLFHRTQLCRTGLWDCFYPAGIPAFLDRRIPEPDFHPFPAQTCKLRRCCHFHPVGAHSAGDRLASRTVMDGSTLCASRTGRNRGTDARPPDDGRPPPSPLGGGNTGALDDRCRRSCGGPRCLSGHRVDRRRACGAMLARRPCTRFAGARSTISISCSVLRTL